METVVHIPHLFLAITAYQQGLPQELLPLCRLQLPNVLPEYLELDLTLSKWYSCNSIARLPRLLVLLPHLHDVMYAHALFTGRIQALEGYFHTPLIRAANLWDIAAFGGHVGSLKFLHQHIPGTARPSAMMWAARRGFLSCVKYLLEIQAPQSSEVWDSAAANGHLEILEYLGANFTGTTRAMDEAASNGHLQVVKFLHKARSEGCTKFAMDQAAGNGHLEVVRWLHENRQEGCTTYAMDAAASNGHFNVVEFLHFNRAEGCTNLAMDWASWSGHIDIVEFLHTQRREGCTSNAIDWAARHGYLDVVRYLHKNQMNQPSAKSLAYAIRGGHLEIVKYLWEGQSSLTLHQAILLAQEHEQHAIQAFFTSLVNRAF